MAAEADGHDDDKVWMHQMDAEIKQLRRKKEDLVDTIEILKISVAILRIADILR